MVAGEVIHVAFEGKAMHFFDIETEYNLLTDNQYHAEDDPETPIKSNEAESELPAETSPVEEPKAEEKAEEAKPEEASKEEAPAEEKKEEKEEAKKE